MSAEHDSLLPIKNVRNHASYGWRYWTKGFCLAMSNNKGATLALLFCYLLQMLQECCPLIESFCKQYFLKHGSYKAVPVVDLVFTVIAPSLVDMVKEFQAVIDREAHRRIQGILNGKRGDLVDDQPLSLNKIMAVEAYYQDIRSLLIKSGAMAITIGSLTTQRPITGSFCVLLYALYSFSDIFYIVLDVTKHQENTHGLVAAKSSLSRHPPLDKDFELFFNRFHRLSIKQQLTILVRTLACSLIMIGFLTLSLVSSPRVSQDGFVAMTYGYCNLYQQHVKMKRILEAMASSRAKMEKVLSKLDPI